MELSLPELMCVDAAMNDADSGHLLDAGAVHTTDLTRVSQTHHRRSEVVSAIPHNHILANSTRPKHLRGGRSILSKEVDVVQLHPAAHTHIKIHVQVRSREGKRK